MMAQKGAEAAYNRKIDEIHQFLHDKKVRCSSANLGIDRATTIEQLTSSRVGPPWLSPRSLAGYI